MTGKQSRPWGKILATITGLALAATLANATAATAQEGQSAPQAKGIPSSSASVKLPAEAKFRGDIKTATGPVTVYVQFSGQGAFDATQPQAVKEGREKPVDKSAEVQQKRREINQIAQSVSSQAGATQKLYVTTNTLPGVAITADAANIRKLAARPDVVKITPIVPKTYKNSGTDIDTKALNTWQQNNKTGEGVTIAVLDTGLDYTHADFGGPGTSAAYSEAQKASTPPAGTFDPKKFVGGHDLVGDDYNADPKAATYQPIPHPDDNPLDCRGAGHGTHVAGTAAGYGVDASGQTFKGDYSKLTADDVSKMKIGPGSAPNAKLVSIRVFGCEGSSNVVGQALDYVLDPNGDGKFDDRANIVNMSLGSNWSPTDDPENDIVDNLSTQGILSVVASGNAGDVYDIGGSPGNSRSALTVANSIGSTGPFDAIKVTAPSENAGTVPGQYSVAYDYSKNNGATIGGDVQYAPSSNLTGCTAFSASEAATFKGKWVMLEWDDNDATRACGSVARFTNAARAGATGVVLTSGLTSFIAGISGSKDIPGVQLTKAGTDSLSPAAKAGTLHVEVANSLKASILGPTGALDTLNSSSSRGVHGSNGIVKPDVAAPGTNIASAAVGSGNGPMLMSGTSMATPHVAGIAALVYQNSTLTPYQVKSIVMNTATNDVKSGGQVYGPNRVGSGRVNALDATSTGVLAYASDDPALTSVNFGVVEVGASPVAITKKVTLQSLSNDVKTLSTAYLEATKMPGVSYSVSPSSLTLGAKGTAEVAVTLTINDPTALQKTLDPTMSATQLGIARQFIADASGRLELKSDTNATLRVPVYAAPKPVSDMSVPNKLTFANNASELQAPFTGRGVQQGSGSAEYQSIVAPLVLGATSPEKPETSSVKTTLKSMDLQYVGASSTVPALKAAKQDPSDGVVSFGISTYGNWPALLAQSGFVVLIDTNGDKKADYSISTGVADGLDGILVTTKDLVSGKTVDQRLANGVNASTDTNTMDTNAVTLQVPADALGLDLSKGSAPISYQVVSTSDYSIDSSGQNVPVDQTDWIGFDVVNPALWFGEDSANFLFADAPNSALTVHRADDAKDAKALFLHLHNASMNKAQVVTTEVNALRFADAVGTKFENDINWMADKGLTTGYPDGTYRPYAVMNRDAMAAFLYRLAGQPSFTAPLESPFTDITPSTQFYKEMTWMKSVGLTTGYSEPNGTATFRPTTSLNRDAMAAFLFRFAGNFCKVQDTVNYKAPTAQQFSDVTTENQFFAEIAWAKEKGISTGYPDGTYRPLGGMTREAMAAFIHRLDSYENANGGCKP